MNISPTTLALIVVGAGFLGALVPSLLALRIAHLTNAFEERKHHQELLFRTGFEWWKFAQESDGPRYPIEEHFARIKTFYAQFIDEK